MEFTKRGWKQAGSCCRIRRAAKAAASMKVNMETKTTKKKKNKVGWISYALFAICSVVVLAVLLCNLLWVSSSPSPSSSSSSLILRGKNAIHEVWDPSSPTVFLFFLCTLEFRDRSHIISSANDALPPSMILCRYCLTFNLMKYWTGKRWPLLLWIV